MGSPVDTVPDIRRRNPDQSGWFSRIPKAATGRSRVRPVRPASVVGPPVRAVRSSGISGSSPTGVDAKVCPALIYAPCLLSSAVLFVLIALGVLDDVFLTDIVPRPAVQDAEVIVPVLDSSHSPVDIDTVSSVVYTRHQVERGETLSRIAYNYGLSPSTIISINTLHSADDLTRGSSLIIPYRDGLRVSGERGRSARDVADQYGVGISSVYRIPDNRDYFVVGIRNHTRAVPGTGVKAGIESAASTSGQPGAARDDGSSVALASMGSPPVRGESYSVRSSTFSYPVSGRVLTGYGQAIDELTGISYTSEGIDLAAPEGDPVLASRRGTVILTGRHSSYGLYAILSHPGGWRSFYGHLSRVGVTVGDRVEERQGIGTVGSSGTARSPRLYFALFRNGKSVDPLDHLN